MNILYVNPNRKECGIYQFGKRVADAIRDNIAKYGNFDFSYYENYDDYDLHLRMIAEVSPDVILYSFNSNTLPCITPDIRSKLPGVKHVCICHEQEQCMVDSTQASLPYHFFGSSMFDAWVGFDPTLVLGNKPNLFRAARPVLRSEWKQPPATPTFGSSTFGFPNKGHLRVVQAVQNEYDNAVIRFNMPPSIYGDPGLGLAKQTEARCRAAITKPGIILEVSNTLFETEAQVVDWLYGNSVNIFDYDQADVPGGMRGVASSPDNALSTRRPLIVTGCTMFRHLTPAFGRYPEDGNINTLIERQRRNNIPDMMYNEWSPERTAGDIVVALNKVVTGGN